MGRVRRNPQERALESCLKLIEASKPDSQPSEALLKTTLELLRMKRVPNSGEVLPDDLEGRLRELDQRMHRIERHHSSPPLRPTKESLSKVAQFRQIGRSGH